MMLMGLSCVLLGFNLCSTRNLEENERISLLVSCYYLASRFPTRGTGCIPLNPPGPHDGELTNCCGPVVPSCERRPVCRQGRAQRKLGHDGIHFSCMRFLSVVAPPCSDLPLTPAWPPINSPSQPQLCHTLYIKSYAGAP